MFKPTYLYIKKHRQTGLKYFGKTTKADVITYCGSGTRWSNHLRKHGKDVETIWHQRFDDEQNLVDFALAFSEIFEIAESDEWANVIPENGITGFPQGNKIAKGIKQTPEWIHKRITNGRIGRKHSEETKASMRAARKGIPKRKVACDRCGQVGGISRMKQYHFDNCKKCPQ